MYRVPQRLYGWWRQLDNHDRVQASLVFVLGLLGLAHYLVFCIPQQFYIEDAGISFAFARNLVEGEGLVTYPGGERVEGYSNPTWTFLVALFYAMGVPPWTSAKIMGAVFGFLTLPMVYGTTRRALRGRQDLDGQGSIARGQRLDRLALLAPAMLVISPQFAIWNASGLENSLFCFLLGAGTFRVVQEGQEPERRPISALVFALLAMTRPEGIVYAAIGFLAVLLGGVERRHWRRPLIWVAALLIPWALYQWWRYSYFSWTWPNTYYAKLGKGTTFDPFAWPPGEPSLGQNSRGWKYVIGYFKSHHIIYFFPFLALALSGWKTWSRRQSERLNPGLQWAAEERRTLAQVLGLVGALVMLDAVFQPWMSGGQILDSVFGSTVDSTGLESVRGFSTIPGLVALVLAILATIALTRHRLEAANALGMAGLAWGALSVGHFISGSAAMEGNGGLEPGIGPLMFSVGSLWVLSAAGGLARWRSSMSALILLAVSLVLLWDGPLDIDRPFWISDSLWPEGRQDWIVIRVWTLVGAAVTLGLLTLSFRGWRGRGVLWASMIFGTFFAVYSGGDWMKQHRWFSLVSVSMMPLMALGVATVLEALPVLRGKLLLGNYWVRSYILTFVGLVLASAVYLQWVVADRDIQLLWAWLKYLAVAAVIPCFLGGLLWKGLCLWRERESSPSDDGSVRPKAKASARVSGWRRWGFRLSTVLALGGLYVYGKSEIVDHSIPFAKKPETGVRDINRRVRYMSWVQRRMDIDDVTLLDVDMGAHMYFSGWDIVDIAGLVDVPMSRHSDFNKKFISEYIFGERNPDFAHVHGGWARTSKIPTHPEWDERYLELPGYPLGKGKCKDKKYKNQSCTNLHVGNHVRKDLFVDSDQVLPEDVILFGEDVSLVHLELPSPEVAPGGRLYIDSSWHRAAPNKAKSGKLGFRIVAILSDDQGHRVSAVLPPGYDWYKPGWGEDEVIHGRYRMLIPRSFPQGTYALSLVILDEKSGEVLSAEEGSASMGPVFAEGEWSSGLSVTIFSSDEAYSAAKEDLRQAMEAARSGDCEAVWPHWKSAERHVMKREDWRERQSVRVREAIAGCWIDAGEGLEDRADLIDALVQARGWYHQHSALQKPSAALAAQLDTEGDAAWREGDVELAFASWSTVMALDPSRSETRKKVEEARDQRLCILRPGRNQAPQLIARSVFLEPPGDKALSANQKLVGKTEIQVLDPDADQMIRCHLDEMLRIDAYPQAERTEISDFPQASIILEVLPDAASADALDEEILALDNLPVQAVQVGWRPLPRLADGTPEGVMLVWRQGRKRLGFVIRDPEFRELKEWQASLKAVIRETIDAVTESHKSFRYKVVDGASVPDASATINQKGRLSYRGPEGVRQIQDSVTIEVTDSGNPKHRVQIEIAVSTDRLDQVETKSAEDAQVCSCGRVASGGSGAWLIGLFVLLGWRRRG